jgi:hypothetical protein
MRELPYDPGGLFHPLELTMKRTIVTLAVAASLLLPAAARADQSQQATLTAFTVEQGIDCLTTLAVLRGGGYERNPIAAPFTHSAMTQFGAAFAVNMIARKLPLRIMRTVVDVYPVVLFSNMRAMGTQAGMAGQVIRPGARIR